MTNNIILIVDDDALMRWSLATNLEDEGFEPRAFGSGPEALQYLADGGAAAAMLLDWQMPGMDGITVLRNLRRQEHMLPVIFLTGHSHPGRREVAMACGAAAFLDKTKSFSTVLHYLRLAVSETDDLEVTEPPAPPLPPMHAMGAPYAGK
ncbi:MAG TPA: response regulator [Alphaproteobacteria bacterium]|nr:response regulator [Alphaproteobacteria bacterium]